MSKQNPIDLTGAQDQYRKIQFPHNYKCPIDCDGDCHYESDPEDSDVEILKTPPTKKAKKCPPTPAKSSSSSSYDASQIIEDTQYQCSEISESGQYMVDECGRCYKLKVMIRDICTCDDCWAEADADERYHEAVDAGLIEE